MRLPWFRYCYFYLVVVDLIGPSQAKSGLLRRHKAEINNLQVERSRQLAVFNSRNGTDSDADDDDSDVDLINRMVTELLPGINAKLQLRSPDPFDAPFEGTIPLGEMETSSCKTSVDFELDLSRIVGLSRLSIDALEVIPGTERVDAGCLQTFWNAKFHMTVSAANSFGDMLSIQDIEAGFMASECASGEEGTVRNDLTGRVDARKPTFQGTVLISGGIWGITAVINLAEIEDVLVVGHDQVEGILENVSPEFQQFEADATTEMSSVMEELLVDTVEPRVRSDLRGSIDGAAINMPYGQSIAVNAGFVRNSLQRRVSHFYQNTLSFFGG
ncbi:expressed unknown protein [Seminavis robusta]|uniref:Uncharacterized protein n=1 Tax=Seminavis robusta TaxID=568900 RepID=A0A9N8D7F5_9STRA|nr:expressed unknown protein [Seminavis robusta]|eukprot:Sro20_g014320.1 n/a (329) ;mRNA; r:140081-141067